MKYIIDTNIVFSALLNPHSPIGQIILNGSKYFTFLSVQLLRQEIDRHEKKILKISGLSQQEFIKIFDLISSKIRFVNHCLISAKNFEKALKLTKDIDTDDLLFVGLSLQLKGKLWTGDKKLISGLVSKGFKQIITTETLFQNYLNKELKRKF